MSPDYISRDVGQFPLSIGTSMAIEGLLGIHPNNPKQPAGYKNMKVLWVNLRTIARNLYQAMKAEDTARIKYVDAVLLIAQEVETIKQTLANQLPTMKAEFYLEDFNDFKWEFPKANLKQAKTPKQVAYKTYEDLVMRMTYQYFTEEKIPFKVVKRNPGRVQETVVMLSHVPHHLLWQGSFDRLMLLESHTGRLKVYNTWFTKLNNITEEHPMPFNKFTLQVFGDGVVFEGQPKPIRDELKQLAEFKRWTGITGREKMAADVFTAGSAALKKTFAELA